MGITKRKNSSIRDFWPDNTARKLYIAENGLTLDDLLSRAYEYFGDAFNGNNITISFENINTNCIDYDLHDPFDWTEFTIIELDND